MSDWRSRNREARRLYAGLGFKIFPADPITKRPLCDNGFYEASSNIEEIEEWWRIWPDAAMAAPLGLGLGMFVYDVDPDNGGMASHQELIKTYGELPPTWVCRSGGGGQHYYFRYPRRKVSNRKGVRPGIDIQSDGSYVLIPFSSHKSGNIYKWEEGKTPGTVALADAPDWLIELANDKPLRSGAGAGGYTPSYEDLDGKDRIYPKGIRENSLVSLIGSMNRRGMTRDSMIAAMVAEDKLRCRPPLGAAEVEKIVDKQIKAYKPDPEEVLGASLTEDEPAGFPARSSLKGVASPDAGYIEEIVSSMLGKGTTTLLAASWKSGKTFVTYRLILDGLLGKPAFGILHVPKPLKVLILQMEMPIQEDERRLRRIAIGSGVDPEQIPKLVEEGRLVHYSRPATDLTTKKDITAFLSFVYAQQFDLVVVDSLVAAFSSIDINDNPRVRQVYKDLLIPLSNNGVSNLILHHFRKEHEQPAGYKRGRNAEKSAILGAQTWGAASDRLFTLEGVEPKDRKLDPGELMLRINLVGGWSKSAFTSMVLHMYDDGDGTIFEVEKNEAVVEITQSEQAVKDICLKMREAKEISQNDLIVWLMKQGYSRRVAFNAKDLAGQRGHLLTTSKKPVIFKQGKL